MVYDNCKKKYHKSVLKEKMQKVIILNTADGWWVQCNTNGVGGSILLSRTLLIHLNVEYCNSVEYIKYICQYYNNSSDKAVFTFLKVDEVMKYETDDSSVSLRHPDAFCFIFLFMKGFFLLWTSLYIQIRTEEYNLLILMPRIVSKLIN